MLGKKIFLVPEGKQDWSKDHKGHYYLLVKDTKHHVATWKIVVREEKKQEPEEEGSSELCVETDGRPAAVFKLIFDKKEVKASIYPAQLKDQEEVQFPVCGAEHFIYLVAGEAVWIDRESEKHEWLGAGHLLQVTREDLKKEYLNLKVKGDGPNTRLLWVVLHYLSNDKGS